MSKITPSITFSRFVLFFVAAFLCVHFTHAETLAAAPVSAFKNVLYIAEEKILVPTVVELQLPESLVERDGVLVFEDFTGNIIPHFFKEQYRQVPEPFTVDSTLTSGGAEMTDGDLETSFEYSVLENRAGIAEVTLTSKKKVSASRIALDLSPNVTLPETVEIRAVVDGGEKIVVAKRFAGSSVFNFPFTVTDSFTITFTYTQPLRISEIRVIQDSAESTVSRTVRFLMQPNERYSVFMNPDRAYTVAVGEAGDLQSNRGVRILPSFSLTQNPEYSAVDADEDGVLDVNDNCPANANSSQEDVDTNGVGDVCDDYDRDGIVNSIDNCSQLPNRNQKDEDGDSIGDVCDKEESRFTERHTWVPWAGMGIALLVIVGLFGVVLMKPKNLE